MIAGIIGGIGLFLLGMILMTEGLKSLAGDALRGILERFVRGPLTGLFWGTGITALVQSSSATTIMTIGFVSAGLLTFSQSIGVILGANLGTTSTGWIVSTVGLKFSMSAVALPMIGVGAMLRLVGGARLGQAGIALAGFGLIFVGIDTLQAGMAGLAERIDPASFPGMTLLGVPALIVIGAAMTIVMQSSSAAVATTLAALYTGAISIEQAAVLVIGQNIGTTVKAILASIGASVPARRTAATHILFNLITGLIALILLPLFLRLMYLVAEFAEGDPGAVSLAAFHTAFNIVGVLVFLPMIGLVSKLVVRLVPERKPELVRHLDSSVSGIPSVAIEAVRLATLNIAAATIRTLRSRLQGKPLMGPTGRKLHEVELALKEVQQFLGRISTESASAKQFERQLASVHAADHLRRLADACREPFDPDVLEANTELKRVHDALLGTLHTTLKWIEAEEAHPELVPELEALSRESAEVRKRERARLLESAAAGSGRAAQAVAELEALLWIDRLTYHLWRAAYHLQRTPGDGSGENADAYVDPSPEHDAE